MSGTEYFKEVATKWDTMRKGFFSNNVREKAYAVAGVTEGNTAADLGAGTGFLTEGLVNLGARVIAVDEVSEMLDVLKENIPQNDLVETRLGESKKIPIDNDSVEYVFANMYLHHVESPPEAIKEMFRITKKGGKAVITDLDEHEFEYLRTEHNDRWMGFKREDIEQWFISAGFSDVTVGCVGETCDSTSDCGGEDASINIFIASGTK